MREQTLEPTSHADEDEHLVTLYGHKDLGSVTWNGREFDVFDGGEVDVPPEAVADLLSHGFSRTPPAEVLAMRERMLAERAETERLEAEAEAERVANEKAEAARKAAEDDAEKARKAAEAKAIADAKADEGKTTPKDTSKGAKNAPNAGA